MSAEDGPEGSQAYEDAGSQYGGPGAPTPLSALEVRSASTFTRRVPAPFSFANCSLTLVQGNGISARDIKTIVEAGLNTVESIAYTYVSYSPLIARHYNQYFLEEYADSAISVDRSANCLRSRAFQKQRRTS